MGFTCSLMLQRSIGSDPPGRGAGPDDDRGSDTSKDLPTSVLRLAAGDVSPYARCWPAGDRMPRGDHRLGRWSRTPIPAMAGSRLTDVIGRHSDAEREEVATDESHDVRRAGPQELDDRTR